MSMQARLAKLEARRGHQVPIWCDHPNDMPAAIAEMGADGTLVPADIALCVFWAEAGTENGAHERALEEL